MNNNNNNNNNNDYPVNKPESSNTSYRESLQIWLVSMTNFVVYLWLENCCYIFLAQKLYLNQFLLRY